MLNLEDLAERLGLNSKEWAVDGKVAAWFGEPISQHLCVGFAALCVCGFRSIVCVCGFRSSWFTYIVLGRRC